MEQLLKFIDLYKIKELKRTGLRYVNHIPFVRIKGLVPISKYLNIKIALPGNEGKDFEELGTVLVSRLGKGKLRTIFETRSAGKQQRAEVLLLDFDYFFEGALKAKKCGKLLEESHQHTKSVFLSFISKDYMKVMRGETS